MLGLDLRNAAPTFGSWCQTMKGCSLTPANNEVCNACTPYKHSSISRGTLNELRKPQQSCASACSIGATDVEEAEPSDGLRLSACRSRACSLSLCRHQAW